MRILILGGYGVFGGRLAHLLKDLPQLTLLIGGRDEEKARRFCDQFTGHARALPVRLDRNHIARELVRLQPDLVVDASGPFQAYGDDPYRVVKACIAERVSYLDFADGADFVFGITQFEQQARQAGVFVLSGVSSFPVLTAAVLREIAKTMSIAEVWGGIAPSPHAGIGLNVMRAVIGYAGAPVKLTRGGVRTYGVGLAESRRYTVAVPGKLPLHSVRFSLVDVPDLQVLPSEHPGLTDIWMGAGPVPEVLHRILNLLAKARYRLHLPSLEPFSRLFYFVLNLMRFGEHRGGMFVHVRGLQDGQPVERSWHLLAEGDDGPLIPSMAIEAIIRKLLAEERPVAGARSAARALELADYEQLFASRTISKGFRDGAQTGPLYRRILGSALNTLPKKVRQLHDNAEERCWQGYASVQRGHGLLAQIIAKVIGFPNSADRVAVAVRFVPDGTGERWIRTFGDQTFHSHQSAGQGRNKHLVVERFGIVQVALALVVREDRLHLVPRRWSVLGLPMPRVLLPSGESFETQIADQFSFNVDIRLPLIGRVVSYKGLLEPAGD